MRCSLAFPKPFKAFKCHDLSGFEIFSLRSCSAAVTSCERQSSWPHALAVFVASPERTVVSYNAAISACGGQWQRASQLLREEWAERHPIALIFKALRPSFFIF